MLGDEKMKERLETVNDKCKRTWTDLRQTLIGLCNIFSFFFRLAMTLDIVEPISSHKKASRKRKNKTDGIIGDHDDVDEREERKKRRKKEKKREEDAQAIDGACSFSLLPRILLIRLP
jgi:hypothetical protein